MSVSAERAVLMAAEIQESGHGFHRFVFKVEGGRQRMSQTTVLISQDAHRKLLAQLTKARIHTFDKPTLLKNWARWELAQRIRDGGGVVPGTVTITASDLDDFGAYASDLARSIAS